MSAFPQEASLRELVEPQTPAPEAETAPATAMEQFVTGVAKVIYVYSIPKKASHQNLLKVGDTEFQLPGTLEELLAEATIETIGGHEVLHHPLVQQAAHRRIQQQVNTAGIAYTLEWSALALKETPSAGGKRLPTYFRDHELHNFLKRAGFKNVKPDEQGHAKEWFPITLQQAQAAFVSAATGRPQPGIAASALSTEGITLRSEQEKAVAFALKRFEGAHGELLLREAEAKSKGEELPPHKVLWSAIMRFGKTLSTYSLVKESQSLKRVLVLTHRPAVLASWHEDFGKIFPERPATPLPENGETVSTEEVQQTPMHFASKTKGETWEQVHEEERFIYFASVQDLRDSFDRERGELPFEGAALIKNEGIYALEWDLIVLDESHEGLLTDLADTMMQRLKTRNWLYLSGTPLNIIEDFDANNVYTWDYVDERQACEKWAKDKPNLPNPYEDLPVLKPYTYTLGKEFQTVSPGGYFDFRKFFETETQEVKAADGTVKTMAKFTREADVFALLNLITKHDPYRQDSRHMPFETPEMKRIFKHTFWLLPTVEACEALAALLKKHSFFCDFKTVNVAGGNVKGSADDAVAMVRKAIDSGQPTITLSVGRLTTGVTVPEWTAVFMLSNIKSPMLYLQTIFRCKSSGILPDGSKKTAGYVFDFAPDRTLEMVYRMSSLRRSKTSAVAETAGEASVDELAGSVVTDEEGTATATEEQNTSRDALEELVKYLPVMTWEDNSFTPINDQRLMRRVKRVFINRAVTAGFETPLLYDFAKLRTVDKEAAKQFMSLQKTVGSYDGGAKQRALPINESGLTKEQAEALAREKVAKRGEAVEAPDPEVVQRAKKQLTADQKNASGLSKILNSVSVRVPLLVFAADVRQLEGHRITVENFNKLMDDTSWEEFMPRNFVRTQERAEELGLDASCTWDFAKQFYDRDVFEGACEAIREAVVRFGSLATVEERVLELAKLFATFKNPDKETVLTPFRVLNIQYGSTLGGYRWVDDQGRWYCEDGEAYPLEEVEDSGLQVKARYIPLESDEDFWASEKTTILELNSKTALYPLYAAVSLFKHWQDTKQPSLPFAREEHVWRDIIREQIFVNCRVPYSKRIAEQVLATVSAMGLDFVREQANISCVDVLEVRAHLLGKTGDEKVTKATRLSESEEGALWRHVFHPEDYSSTEERVKELLKMPREELKKLAAACEQEAVEKFSAVCSNPPYQIATGESDQNGQQTVTNVFQHFQSIANYVAYRSCMIYPAGRWLQGSGKGLSEFGTTQLNSPALQSVTTFPGTGPQAIFPNVGIGDGVSVVFMDHLSSSSDFLYNGRRIAAPGDRVLPLSSEWVSLVTKIMDAAESCNLGFIHEKVSPQKLFGIESNFVEENPDKVTPFERLSPEEAARSYLNPVKLLTNDKAGKTGRPKLFWTDSRYIPQSQDKITRWKFVIKSAQFAHERGQIAKGLVLDNATAFGRAKISLADFATQEEAEHFKTYMNTRLMTGLYEQTLGSGLAHICAFVPDLGDYTDGNPDIDWSKPLDPQLYKLFKLTEEEIAVIEGGAQSVDLT